MNYFEHLVSLGRFSPKPGAVPAASASDTQKRSGVISAGTGLPDRKPGDFSVKIPAGDIAVSIREPQPIRMLQEPTPAGNNGRALAEEISDEVMFDALRGRV